MNIYRLKRMLLMPLCSLFGDKFTKWVNDKFHIFIIFHRPYCRKEGRCIKCGRYICSGCNTSINDEYGYCGVCSEGNKINDVILPIRPLIKPKVKRFTKSCNDERPWDFLGDY